MKNQLVVFGLVLATSCGAFASGTTSRPRRKAPPKRRTVKRNFKPSTPSPAQSPEHRAIYERVSFYIQAKSTGSQYVIPEPRSEGDSWKLTPVNEAPVVTDIGKGRKKIRRNFVGSLGSDSTQHKVALDFFVSGMGTRWRVSKAKIVSVNGNER